MLLLAEPAAGMNPAETAELTRTLRDLAEAKGVTTVVAEPDMRLVMALCSRIQVLDRGLLIADGPPAAIGRDPRVVEAYLGTRRGERARAHADAIEVWRGPSRVLRGINLTVGEGEIAALLGANGAGKTSTLLAVSGHLRPRAGRIRPGP